MHRRTFATLALAFATAAFPAALFAQVPQSLTITLQQTTPNPVLARGIVGYIVTVRNTGRAPYSGIQVRVGFPGSAWGIPATGVGTGCAFAGGGGAPTALVTCTAGGLAPAAATSIALQIAAPPSVANGRSQQFTVTAGLDVNGTLAGTGGADAIAMLTTEVVALPDLDPQWAGPLTVTAGRDVTYTLQVRNAGSGLATDVRTRITLPREVDLVRLEQSTFRSCPVSGQEINCSELAMAPGSVASLNLVVRPLPLLSDGTRIAMSVGVDPANGVRESRETNNTAFIAPTVRAEADLQLTGTLAVYDMRPGDRSLRGLMCSTALGRNMTAVLRIRNNGPGQSPATSVRVGWLSGRNIGNEQCSAGMCCVNGSCLPPGSTGSCPPPGHFFSAATVPALAPGTEIVLTAKAKGDIPAFPGNQVEWGSVTLDSQNVVNDPDRRNNTWVMHP